MSLPETLYYLADRHDRHRLSRTGDIAPAHDCHPWYFTSPQAALGHPEAGGLEVFAVPTAETIPGAPVGTRIHDAIAADDVILALMH